MKLIVGLGNPGKRYEGTRHNVGFMVVDALASKVNCGRWSVNGRLNSSLYNLNKAFLLVKPQTFMNAIGQPVKNVVAFYKIQLEDIWIIHDDLDIRLGEYKIQKGVGPKLHYGIASIENSLGTPDFWRVRIGVDNRLVDNRTSGETYVLQNFSETETRVLSKVIDRVVSEIISHIHKDDK